jgi:hypothetical protein
MWVDKQPSVDKTPTHTLFSRQNTPKGADTSSALAQEYPPHCWNSQSQSNRLFHASGREMRFQETGQMKSHIYNADTKRHWAHAGHAPTACTPFPEFLHMHYRIHDPTAFGI